jgi:hypothetical protein
MAHGGARPGAGRKRGSPNRATQERQARVAATGQTPLDFLLSVFRDESVDLEARLEAAKAAAAYVHPRLSSIDIKDLTPPLRSLEEIDARLVELFTGALQRRDQGGRIASLQKKPTPLIEGDRAAADEMGARPVGIDTRKG